MYNYSKTQIPPYDPPKLAIRFILRPEDDLISYYGQILEKTVSFDNMLHFIDEESIVTYVNFDCGIIFYPETRTKFRQINHGRKYFSISCEKLKRNRRNDRHNCFHYDQHSSNIFLNPFKLWDMVPAALLSLNHTNDRNSLSNQYLQPTTHPPGTESYPLFSSIWTMDSSKRKGLRVSFAFFQRT